MAEGRKPVVLSRDGNFHEPIGSGEVIGSEYIPVDGLAEELISKDPDNLLEQAIDGKLVVKGVSSFVSGDADNLLRNGRDGGAYIGSNDILSNDGENILRISSVDKRVTLPREELSNIIKESTTGSNIVSNDVGNGLKVGSDGKLFVDPVDAKDLTSSDSKVLYVDKDGKLNASIYIQYNNITGKFDLTDKDGDILSSVTVPSSTSMLQSVGLVDTPVGYPQGVYLQCVFLLASGEQSTQYVNMSSLMNVYTAGDGISIGNDYVIKLKVKEGSGLEIDQDGNVVIDASKIDASQLDASKIDASQLDASKIDASQLDASQLDASQLDASKIDASQIVSDEANNPLKVDSNGKLFVDIDSNGYVPIDRAVKSGSEFLKVNGKESSTLGTDITFDVDFDGLLNSVSSYVGVLPDFAMPGVIVAFSGRFGGSGNRYPIPDDANVPDLNWVLCDGQTTNGIEVPDLRDRFVMGAGPENPPGTEGNISTQSVSLSEDSNHYVPGTYEDNVSVLSSEKTARANYNQYYALSYIKQIGRSQGMRPGFISGDSDNSLQQGSDGKLYVHPYTAGSGLRLNNYEFSLDTSVAKPASPATEDPLAPGTAYVGESSKYAREDHVHPEQVDIKGNAATATKLKTARNFSVQLDKAASVSFNGSANAVIGVNGILPVENGGTGNAEGKISVAEYADTAATCTGNASTATRWQNDRTIQVDLSSDAWVIINGTQNVIPGVYGVLGVKHGGTGNATGNAATATKLATARTITTNDNATARGSFDGSANASVGVAVTVAAGTAANTLPGTSTISLRSWLTTARNCLAWLVGRFNASGAALTAVTATTATSCTGNAATATKLATGRRIATNLASTSAGTFDGTANINVGVTGILTVNNGGTGANSAAGAAQNLGVPIVTKSTDTTVGSGLSVLTRIVISSSNANALAISKANAEAIVFYPEG